MEENNLIQETLEKTAKLKELLKEVELNLPNHSLIQDNKLVFQWNNNAYRCRMPNQLELSKAETHQNEIYVKEIKNPNAITKTRLKKILKETQDLDLDDLELQKKKIQQEICDIYIQTALRNESQEDTIKRDEQRVAQLKEEHISLTIEIMRHTNKSIEAKVEKEYLEYLTFLCTQMKVDQEEEKWIAAWKSYEEFQQDNTKLVPTSIVHMDSLLINYREI